jgi:sodium-dependent dicarboxylate transporter 2/3/5
VGLLLGPALALLVAAVPIPGLEPRAHTLAAIMALVVTWWVTEAVPLAATALLGPALAIVFGVAEDKAVLAPFGSPIIFLFVGSFMLAAAIRKYGLDARIALGLLSVRALAATPRRLFATLGLLSAALSMWMSNAATTAMMLPLALGTLRAWPGLDTRPMRSSLVLLIAFAASVGGQGTPVGTPPNLIGLGAIEETLGLRVPFLTWMALGVPLAVVQTAFLLWLLRPPVTAGATDHDPAATLAARRAALGPWSTGERVTTAVFVVAVTAWMVPGALDLALGVDAPVPAWLHAHLPEETVGLLAGVSLLLIPVSWREGRFALTWREAVAIDWGTILVFAGGMALGKQLFETGLAHALGAGVATRLGVHHTWTLAAVGIVLTLVVSEAASNTASATVMVPVMIAVAQGAGADPVPVALASCLASSFGFLLPVSTGPNALAYGTGEVTIPEMMRRGFALDVIGAVSIFVVVRVVGPLVLP